MQHLQLQLRCELSWWWWQDRVMCVCLCVDVRSSLVSSCLTRRSALTLRWTCMAYRPTQYARSSEHAPCPTTDWILSITKSLLSLERFVFAFVCLSVRKTYILHSVELTAVPLIIFLFYNFWCFGAISLVLGRHPSCKSSCSKSGKLAWLNQMTWIRSR